MADHVLVLSDEWRISDRDQPWITVDVNFNVLPDSSQNVNYRDMVGHFSNVKIYIEMPHPISLAPTI